MNQKDAKQIIQDYDTTKGIVYVVEIDGYYTWEEAEDVKKKLQDKGFLSHTAEV